MKYLKPLFDYLRDTKNLGMTSMSFRQIENVIGRRLSNSLRKSISNWNSTYIKAFKHDYQIEITTVNAVAEFVEFKVL